MIVLVLVSDPLNLTTTKWELCEGKKENYDLLFHIGSKMLICSDLANPFPEGYLVSKIYFARLIIGKSGLRDVF